MKDTTNVLSGYPVQTVLFPYCLVFPLFCPSPVCVSPCHCSLVWLWRLSERRFNLTHGFTECCVCIVLNFLLWEPVMFVAQEVNFTSLCSYHLSASHSNQRLTRVAYSLSYWCVFTSCFVVVLIIFLVWVGSNACWLVLQLGSLWQTNGKSYMPLLIPFL